MDPYVPLYKVGLRSLKMGHRHLQPGEPVPHAEDWPRVDAWVRARRLERI